ncbi:CRISPR-associated protein Csx16 [Halomonas qaidamensis]|uniref:CRISPR-associated protein Csx16 n=1 Tax=Halomonas qaidamensis TaxID=2866211 RepID=A0ABY6JS34_9GAMM|nr:CRISPR-associated protein Csx16 [Halomonas qaidamensis]UYV19470.1 CRISPR-associated protein Csx16 [Halomonas qaidamensis]
MACHFVSRHPGAIEWLARQQIKVDHYHHHLDITAVAAGDRVIGTLPVQLVADVCERHAEYWHLSIEMPPALRGHELDADQLECLGAKLCPFVVHKR